MQISLNDIKKVKEFIAITSKYECDIDAISVKYPRNVVDAKSILGLFSLDLSSPIRIDYKGIDKDSFYKEISCYEI